MSIYVIADLHLSFNNNKPMDIFGENWNEHVNKISNYWKKHVTDNDIVILPGDFSWAMHLKDTYEDFKYLNELPGRKILIKGNHDYWWTTVKNMKNFLEENNFKNIDFLQNNSFEYEDYIICGTRGWSFLDQVDIKKMVNRENERLKLSLTDGVTKYGKNKEIIVFMHFPPCVYNKKVEVDGMTFIETMKNYNVKKCFYGHLHGNSHKDAIEGVINGIELKLISADYLNFKLYKVI